MKILLVDDAPEVVEAVRLGMMLQWREVEVLDAGTGPAALDLIDSETPDLVLLDIGLPGMDGYETLREIRAFSDVPVIMLTGQDNTMDKRVNATTSKSGKCQHLQVSMMRENVMTRSER